MSKMDFPGSISAGMVTGHGSTWSLSNPGRPATAK